MEQIKDIQIMNLVERIGEHYRNNIANRFIRPALLQLPLDRSIWTQVETLTEKYEQFHYQGFHIEELYRQVAATTKFITATRREVSPTIRYRLSNGSSSDKVLRDMAVNTFDANLQLFAELVCDLYIRLKELDAANAEKNPKDKRPLFRQTPEYTNLEDELLNH